MFQFFSFLRKVTNFGKNETLKNSNWAVKKCIYNKEFNKFLKFLVNLS